MKYGSWLLALILALSFSAWARDEAPAPVELTEDELADIRVECISEGIAAEVEDDQMDGFVEQCVNAALGSVNKDQEDRG